MFIHSGKLASYAGLTVVSKDCGRVNGDLRRPMRYSRHLHRVFYLAALSLLVADGPSRVFHQKKRGERMLYKQALMALAARLMNVLRTLLHDVRFFENNTPVRTMADWHGH